MSDLPPRPSPPPAEPGALLTSWKEIAAVIGVSTRTAQTYAKEKGLPVQRDGNRVSAEASALLLWQRKRFALLPWRRRRPLLAASALASLLLVLAALAAWLLHRGVIGPRPQPVRAEWKGRSLFAYDAAGRLAWRRDFPFEIHPNLGAGRQLGPWTGDLDRDGSAEVVSTYYHVRRDDDGWDLYAFSSAGETRFRLSVDARVRTPRTVFSPPYVIRSFAVFPSPENDGTRWIAAVFVNVFDSPSVLLVVDAKGRRRGEFWQMGHLNDLEAADLDGDGVHELIAAGVQEIPAQAVLVVFDPRRVAGFARSETPDPSREFLGMPPGTEKATVLFPRTALNRKLEPLNQIIDGFEISGGRIKAAVVEHIALPPRPLLTYTLTPALQVEGVEISGELVSSHRREGLPEPDAGLLKSQVRVVRWR